MGGDHRSQRRGGVWEGTLLHLHFWHGTFPSGRAARGHWKNTGSIQIGGLYRIGGKALGHYLALSSTLLTPTSHLTSPQNHPSFPRRGGQDREAGHEGSFGQEVGSRRTHYIHPTFTQNCNSRVTQSRFCGHLLFLCITFPTHTCAS